MLVINAVGFSDSGKTYLLEALASHYSNKGMVVAAVKDIHGEDFLPDVEGKDTWRLAKAGANPVVGRGPNDTIMRWTQPMPLLEILEKISTDVVLVEGFKQEHFPRIVCAHDASQLELLVDADTYCITGIISEEMEEYHGVPVISIQRDLPRIIELAESSSTRY
jgi:molybdopterin-guanine dinucleotide biosynthesis protein B